MDLENLKFLIENNFWIQQIFSNSTTILLDYTFKKLNNIFNKKDLSWQLLHCLQEAHYNTCNQLNWEYDPDTFILVSKIILTNNINICNEANLVNIFSTAIGQPMSIDDVKCWLNNFEIELSSNEHEHLREFIKLKFLVRENQISHIQKRYLEKFQQIVFSNDNATLFLYQLYIPNNYSIYNGDILNDDLLELIDAFIYDDLNIWLNKKHIKSSDDISALFVFGYQCTGKSTLISKIIYDHYFNDEINSKQIYVVNFSDRSFKNNNLTPREICEYLSIKTCCLNNSILIIDGLDESEWSISVASDKLENLINDLKEFNCKLIVTSRPNYFYTSDLGNTFEIQLAPFSINQAIEWLKTYKEYDPSCNIENIARQIDSLTSDIKKVILIPYVLYTCIINDIQFEKITEIARLYDLTFNINEARLLTTPYNSKSRNVKTNLLQYEKIITEISEYVLCAADNLISETVIEKLLMENSLNSNKITSEFLLYRKDENNYAFMHNSIPCYFIAKKLYNIFTSDLFDKKYDNIIKLLYSFCEKDMSISSSIVDFIEYFARSSTYEKLDSLTEVLKLFLSDQIYAKLMFTADLVKIQRLYYLYFANVLKLIFAFISQHLKPFESYNFFGLLSKTEKEQFISYTKLGYGSLDCINICNFSNINLDDIRLQGINLRGKMMRYTSIRHADFKGSNLSGAYFINSDYSLCCFDDANCKNVDFTDSILFGCSFRNTRLNGANFTNANLECADLRGAQLNKCIFDGASVQGAKILVEQLRSIFDFDIDYIRKNQIQVYLDECLIPDELLEDEYKKQRPISYILTRYGK